MPLEVGTVQKPHPPLWHATRSLESAPRLAGEGCNVALSLPTKDAAAFCAAYRAAWTLLERAPQDMPFLANTRNVVVGDNDRETIAIAKRAFKVWYDSLVHLWRAHDVALPGSSGASLGFLMYPQAETADGRLDCLDPDSFKYEITSRETASTNG